MADNDESALIARGAGKWGDPAFPKTDWICERVADLGEPDVTCEMCEYKKIRNVHHLKHPSGRELKAGCICAGHLTGDLDGAKARDASMRNAAQRFLKRDKRLAEFDRKLDGLGTDPSSFQAIKVIHDQVQKLVDRSAADSHLSPLHGEQEIDAWIIADRARKAAACIVAPMRALDRAIAGARWTETRSGYRLGIPGGGEVKILDERIGYRIGVRCKGERGVTWESEIPRSLGAAQRNGVDILRSKLRKAGRLPPLR